MRIALDRLDTAPQVHPHDPVRVTQPATVTCANGHRSELQTPAVIVADPRADPFPEVASSARCPVCGIPIVVDAPLLIVFVSGLIGAVFVPSTGTSVDRDGEDGARLVRAARDALGRPAFDDARALTSAPARLADVVARRVVECDAIAPRRILLEDLDAERAEDYRAWLHAIRSDVGIAAIVDGVTQVLAGDRWADVLAACRAAPRIGSVEGARVVQRIVEIASTDADEETSTAIASRAALLTDWRANGGDPAALVLTDRHGLAHPISLGVQAELDEYFSRRDDAIDDRIDRLRCVLAAHREGRAPSARVTMALLAGASTELHGRRCPGDLDEALTMLDTAIELAVATHGQDSRDVLRLRADRAVIELDHPDRRVDAARMELSEIQQRAATLAEDDAFQTTAMLNLGTAWLEEGGTTDRGQAQEEGIAWLEQTLAAPGITSELEILASANLAAALRLRLTRQSDDALRANTLNRRAVELARGLHRAGDPERLVGSLAAMANTATEAGRHHEAVEASREALAIAAETMPETHPTRLRAQANGASILHTRANASRSLDPEASDADLSKALEMTRATVAAMAATNHTMRFIVEANLAAILAERDSSGSPIDAAGAARQYEALLGSLDPAADAEVLRTAAWNAGTLALGQGRHDDACRAYRIAWDAAQVLADRALLAAAQQTLQGSVARVGRRLALALATASPPDHAEAFAVLDASRARLVGGVTERARLALSDPDLDVAAREEIANARRALDDQLRAEAQTVATTDPRRRRRQAAQLRALVRGALERIAPISGAPAIASPSIPIVHISTDALGTAVAIRFPDGTATSFVSARLRELDVASLLAANLQSLRHALFDVLELAGPEVAEPLASELLTRGHRAAIVIPGGSAAAIPWNAAPLRGPAGAQAGALTDVIGIRLAPASRLLTEPHAPDVPSHPYWIADLNMEAGRWEVAAAERISGSAPSLAEPATTAAAPWPAETDWLHISTHGETTAHDPLTARLLLPGGLITLADLLSDHRFGAGATVVAPACRSAQVDTSNLDEVLSIGHAFLAAGAETAIGGLWDLPDPATAIIVARLYAHLEHDRLWQHPEVALRSAQRWLRDQTRDTLLAEAAEAQVASTWLAPQLAEALEAHIADDPTEHPFGDPFEWAGMATISVRGPDS
ncbi:MAG: hypothetical protein QOH12_3864 [Solirubrobacteraceae bacterium]|jgi:tetratricopeptide (TPR) repeat protein|nr:hypothetical protein [Solirubrobacteraceae bacterium]